VSTPQAAADPIRAILTGKQQPADLKPLLGALSAAGVTVEADDQAALAAVAAAGPEVVAVVADWVVDAASGGADTT